MTEFGKLLRVYRQQCNDPEHPGKTFSQSKLGELVGREIGMLGGYSAAAVSDWERGKSKIDEDERFVLTSLIKVLHQLGGLKNSSQANRLLEAGNYRGLDAQEKQRIFPEELTSRASDVLENPPAGQGENLKSPIVKNFSRFIDEWQQLVREAEEGPSPSWPRATASLLRRFSNYWTVPKLVMAVFWAWLWLLTWWLITPSLRLPFTSRENAEIALKLYVIGTLVSPLLVGLLATPLQNTFWQEHNLASNYMTHLYTYQGAGIGFHLGYFGVFALNLLAYYLHIHVALWFEWLETGIILLWGYFAAHLVPYNLWRAYGRLVLGDGQIFFVFFLIGPFWAFFFYEMFPLFFTSIVGGLSILTAITLLVLLTAWRQYRSAFSK